jgi:NTP pyrophosphatase (non-canonical NTP hydrolase)
MNPHIKTAGDILTKHCHEASRNAGWWHDAATGADALANPQLLLTMTGWKLALIHSEVSEAMEGFRKDLMDDKLPQRKMAEVELADTVIRLFDLAGAYGFDLGAAIAEKLAYNAIRPDHRPTQRMAAGGKKY